VEAMYNFIRQSCDYDVTRTHLLPSKSR